MELVLTITAGLGALLFIIGYLAFIIAGFRHHFVTGIISALPVLNIVTVPALWSKTSKKLMMSVFGLAIVAASWFFGADAYIKTIIFRSGANTMQARANNNMPQTSAQGFTLSSSPATANKQVVGNTVIRQQHNQTTVVGPFANKQRFINERNMQKMPIKALYKLSFETISVNKINTLKNRVVEIVTNTHKIFQGRITNISSSSILLQSSDTHPIENEFPIANIKQLRLMVKRANKQ